MEPVAQIKLFSVTALIAAILTICFSAIWIDTSARGRFPSIQDESNIRDSRNFNSHRKLMVQPQQKVKSLVIDAELSKLYKLRVNSSIEYILQYSYVQDTSSSSTVLVKMDSTTAFKDHPVLVVVRQQKSVDSWQVPLLLETISGLQEYSEVSRTLCTEPLPNDEKMDHSFFVGISTSDSSDVIMNIGAYPIDDFSVKLNENHTVELSPSEPKFYQFLFPNQVNDVLLILSSDDSTCMSVSIQNLSCPVVGMESTIQYGGVWQSLTNLSGITVNRQQFPRGFFFLFVIHPDDYKCTGKRRISWTPRRKLLQFTIREKVGRIKLMFAVFGVLGIFMIFYIVAFIVLCFSSGPDFSGGETSPLRTPVHDPVARYDSTTPHSGESVSVVPTTFFDSSVDLTDVDLLPDAYSDKNVVRTKTFLYVADLARKSPSFHAKKSKLYMWNLLIVATFYALPAIQLVFIYQNIMNDTGDQDLCYFNFLCAHPLGELSDFNHVYSNIGYVMLGLLFIFITARRDVMNRKAQESHERFEKFYGIPRHYGLFYAMGTALMVEGVLSACYHICPTRANYQFDTTFMYVISVLCVLKIYQTRHPDINAEAPAAFALLAFVVFLGVVSIFQDGLFFRIVFSIIHLAFTLALSAQVYYMGRWKLDIGIFKRIYLVCWNDFYAGPSHWFRPMYFDRMLLLIFGMLTNIGLAVFGLLQDATDFATYLSAIFITNLLLYKLFYIIMKLRHGERILLQPLLYILLSTLSWAAALYFFVNNAITWGKRAAESRTFNRECVILDFYDYHDIWHFLSAVGLFFAFLVLLTLDDGINIKHFLIYC